MKIKIILNGCVVVIIFIKNKHVFLINFDWFWSKIFGIQWKLDFWILFRKQLKISITSAVLKIKIWFCNKVTCRKHKIISNGCVDANKFKENNSSVTSIWMEFAPKTMILVQKFEISAWQLKRCISLDLGVILNWL